MGGPRQRESRDARGPGSLHARGIELRQERLREKLATQEGPAPKEVARRTFDLNVRKKIDAARGKIEAGFAAGAGRSARLTQDDSVRSTAKAAVSRKLRVRKPPQE